MQGIVENIPASPRKLIAELIWVGLKDCSLRVLFGHFMT